MNSKTLAEMSMAELQAELEAARQEYLAADYIEGFHVWKMAREAAQARIDAAGAEWARRNAGEKNG